MGTDCSGNGYVEIRTCDEAEAISAFRADATYGPWVAEATIEDVGDILTKAFGFDVTEYTNGVTSPNAEVRHYEVWYDGRCGGEFAGMLDVLARHGATADLQFTSLSGDIWKLIAAGGTAREVYAVTYFPGDVDPNEPCVAITRHDVRALLALVTGDHVDGLDEVVKKLTDALG